MVIGNRKLKPIAYITLISIIVFLSLLIIIPKKIKLNKLHNSIEYKLSIKGYVESDINKIVKMDDDIKNYLLDNEYNKFYVDIINHRYFILENFNKYIDYHNKNEDYDIDKLVSYVNTESYKEPYEDNSAASLDAGSVILVNKNNFLDSKYVPEKIVNASNWYAYEGVKLDDSAYEAFISMFNDAKDEGLSLILSAGYRSYKEQQTIFNSYRRDYGERAADEMSTRAGFSELQTGLSLTILKLYTTEDKFTKTKEYLWLEENAYRYGFILRYPKDKEYITKYDYSPSRWRYVGIEAASKIYNENITLEEYYAYYIK